MNGLELVFDKGTAFGLFALVTLHLHVGLQGLKVKRALRTLRVLVTGHNGDPVAHRSLGDELQRIERETHEH